MEVERILPVLLAGVTAFVACSRMARGDSDPTGRMTPRGDIRVIHTADGHQLYTMKYLIRSRGPSAMPTEADLCRYVDDLAANDVDVFSPNVFYSGFAMWDCASCDWWTFGYECKDLQAAGLEPIAIWAKRCHQHEMKIMAKFRMNDRHCGGDLTSKSMGSFLREHQEWWLKAFPGGLDFSFQGVRDWLFAVMQEVVQTYDVDGLELDYMRFPHVFPPGDPETHQPVLTAFTRRIRNMLTKEGRNKGRKLLLGVRVPQTLQECHQLSLDVPVWIEKGLIDYVCPSDFVSPDFDAPYEEFSRLTRKSDCTLYPAVHPLPLWGQARMIFMSEPNYRALVNNFYAQGADGLSTFNYQYYWEGMLALSYAGVPENYPKAFEYLKGLRNPERLLEGDRHYVFYPLRRFFGLKDRSGPKMVMRRDSKTFSRYAFRAAEDLGGRQKALLRFSAAGMRPGDTIQVRFNGKVVPADKIEQRYYEQGRTRDEEGLILPAYTRCEFVPETAGGAFGENVLEARLLRSANGATGDVTVPEIELAVSASGKEPDEIMRMMHYEAPEPVEVLAGYHPSHPAAWKDIDANRQQAGRIWKGAQRFVLAKKARVTAVDILLMPDQEKLEYGDRGIVMTLESDDNRRPSGRPASEGATVELIPWKTPRGLTMKLQGYYRFEFAKPLELAPGTYWMVMENKGGGVYYPMYTKTSKEHYPEGAFVQGGKEAEGVCPLFGVFGEYISP